MNRMQSRDVFLVENYLAPISQRREIIKTLLQRLNVPRIYFINSSSASMLACGGDTGIVVDVGYREIRVVPVCYGAVQNFAIKYRPGGHVAIRKRIVEQIPKLKELGSDELDRFLRTVCTVRINKETESKEEEEKEERKKEERKEEKRERKFSRISQFVLEKLHIYSCSTSSRCSKRMEEELLSSRTPSFLIPTMHQLI